VSERKAGEEELVTVHHVPDEATATMLRDFLEGQGIEAAIISAQIPWLGTIETARKGYWGRIAVLEHEAERARELIADFLAARPEPDASTPFEGQQGDR
jgi:hypothetical protein